MRRGLTGIFNATCLRRRPLSHLPQAVIDATANGAHLVTALRDYLGYTQEQLSIASGLTLDEIASIEGESSIRVTYISRLARALAQPESTVIAFLTRKP